MTVVQAQEHREEGDERLPTPYIPLDEAVHLTATDHIGLDFTDDALLRLGQVEGEAAVESTHALADTGQEQAWRSRLAVTLHPEETELDEEEFVELEPSTCRLQPFLRHGEVYLLDGFGIGHQACSRDDLWGEGLGDVGDARLLEDVEELAHLTAVEPCARELLSEGIDGHQPTADLRSLRLLIDFGMADAVRSIEVDGLAED